MRFEEFARRTRGLDVIDMKAFRGLWPNSKHASVAIDRWVKAGKLVRLRRGKYLLGGLYSEAPSLLRIAGAVVEPSYVSLRSALIHHGLVRGSLGSEIQSITTARSALYETAVGTFRYRSVKGSLFWGYDEHLLGTDRGIPIATPEKALLDLVYLTPHRELRRIMRSLAPLDLSRIDAKRLRLYARRSMKPRLKRFARRIAPYCAVLT